MENINIIGWTKNGERIEAPEGYAAEHYFDASGKYLGADEDGIGLMFETI